MREDFDAEGIIPSRYGAAVPDISECALSSGGPRKSAGYGVRRALGDSCHGRMRRRADCSRCALSTSPIATFSGTAPGKSVPGWKAQTLSGQSDDRNRVVSAAACFPLPWLHYARLLAVRNLNAREFYEVEALPGGWTS